MKSKSESRRTFIFYFSQWCLQTTDKLLLLSIFICLSGLLWNQSMSPSIQQLVVNSSRHIDHFTEKLDEDAQTILTKFYTLLSNSNLGVCRRHKHYDLEPNEVIMLTKNESGGEVLYETKVAVLKELPADCYPVSWFWDDQHGWVPSLYTNVKPSLSVTPDTLDEIRFDLDGFDTVKFGLMVNFAKLDDPCAALIETTFNGRRQTFRLVAMDAIDRESSVWTLWMCCKHKYGCVEQQHGCG
jgi:hypothetical protein